MTDELSALDLWRIADGHHFAHDDTVVDVKLAGELFAVSLAVAAAKIDSRIEVPPIRWREITDGKDYYAYQGAMHDRKEWLECAKECLRDGVFLADVPLGWLGPLPPFALRTTVAFVDWLRSEAAYVQGFLSSPNIEHPEWQLTIAQHTIHNANTWLALHLKREIPPTPGDIAECARQLVNLLVSLPAPDGGPATLESSDGTRKKRTKEETTKLVHAAIAFKMKNPEWSESKCAEEAGLSVSTLNGNSVWQEWKRKIDSAQNSGTLSAIKRAFDRRTGEFLAVDDTETDDSE